MSGSVNQVIAAAGNIPQQQNPLQMMGQVQEILNAQAQNKLQQQQLLNSQQELINSKQQNENAQLANQTGQTNLNNANSANYARATFALRSLGDDQRSGQAGYDNIKKVADDMLAKNPGASSENIHAQTIASLPPPVGADGKPTDYTPWINQHFLAAAGNFSGPELAKLLVGDQQNTTLPGGMTQVVQTPGIMAPPGTPTRNVGSPVGGGMEPASGATLVYVDAPDGTRQGPFPAASIGEMVRQGFKVSQNQAGAATPAQPAQPVVATQGAVGGNQPIMGGPAAQPVAAPAQAQPVAPAQPAQPAQVTTTLPVPKLGQTLPSEGQVALANASRAKDAADMADLSGKNFSDMQQSLQSIWKLAPTVNSGKGEDKINTAKQILTNLVPGVAKTIGIDANKSMDQQDLWKSLSRAAMANGNRSDAQLFESMQANPHADMSPAAMQRAAGYVLALNNQESVLTQEAHAQATHQPLDLNTQNPAVRLAIQNKTDVNAFRSPYMSDGEHDAYVKSLSPAGKQKFLYTLGLMQKYQQPGGGMGNTQGQ